MLVALGQLTGGAAIGAAVGALGGWLLRVGHRRSWAEESFAGPGRGGPREVFYVEQTAGMASMLVWMAFGAVAVPEIFGRMDWRLLLYAALSLSVVRMVPVAMSLVGTDLGRRTVLFLGWFGPRGLASVVFALLAVEELGAAAEPAVAAIVVTVLLSVLAHGLTAGPIAVRSGGAPNG